MVFMLKGIAKTKSHKNSAGQIQDSLMAAFVMGVAANILELSACESPPVLVDGIRKGAGDVTTSQPAVVRSRAGISERTKSGNGGAFIEMKITLDIHQREASAEVKGPFLSKGKLDIGPKSEAEQ